MLLIFVSFESKKDAERVANFLVDHHLAACVTLIPTESYYFWKRKKVHTRETEAIIKTTQKNSVKIQKALDQLLDYETPQIITVATSDVNEKYQKWVESEVSEKWT